MAKKKITTRSLATNTDSSSKGQINHVNEGKLVFEFFKPGQQDSERKTFTTGAFRSPDADRVRLDLNCPSAYLRWGGISAEGSGKYGAFNWAKGMPVGDTLNHAERHLAIAKLGGNDEGDSVLHLAKVMWNCAAVIHFLTNCKCGNVGQSFEQVLDEYTRQTSVGKVKK